MLSGRYSLPCRTIRQVGRLSGATRDPARPGAQGLDKQGPARSVNTCKDTGIPVPSSVPTGTIPCRLAHFVLGRAVVSVRQQLPTSCSCYLTPPALAPRYCVCALGYSGLTAGPERRKGNAPHCLCRARYSAVGVGAADAPRISVELQEPFGLLPLAASNPLRPQECASHVRRPDTPFHRRNGIPLLFPHCLQVSLRPTSLPLPAVPCLPRPTALPAWHSSAHSASEYQTRP